MTSGLVIRTKQLDGRIVPFGTDYARGITIEQPDFQADDAGPSTASFVLKRDPRVQWPDLRAGAPIVVTRRGRTSWRGRIKQTPMTDGGTARQIAVQCEGQQALLDDDSYQRLYVATDLSQWRDSKSNLATPLGQGAFCVAGTVSNADDGSITLGFPNNYGATNNDVTGIYLDCGAGNAATNLALVVRTSNNNNNPAALQLVLRIGAQQNADGTGTQIYSQFLTTIGAGPTLIDLNVLSLAGFAARILAIQLQCAAVPGLPAMNGDAWVQIQSATVFGAAAYESSGVSILKASDVVIDALSRATMGLSSDRSRIAATSFTIPELVLTTPQTPRDVIKGVNAYHGMQFRIAADNVPEFRVYPAAPTIEVGADSRFNEASAGDLSDIYTGVIVTYTDAAGQQQSYARSQPPGLTIISNAQPSNASALSNTTGWTSWFGTLTRDTTVYDSAPASFKVALAFSGGPYLGIASTSAWTSAPVAGRLNTLSLVLRQDNPSALGVAADVFILDGGTGALVGRGTLATMTPNAQTPLSIPWTPQTANPPELRVAFYGAAAGASGWFDSIVNTETSATIVDRWGFKRTKVLDTGMTLTPAAAQQIADTFLAAHRTTPLKGTLTITGDGRAWRTPSGAGLAVDELLSCTGDLVRMRHLVDPDTGKLGRLGRIASVDYDAAANTAQVEIDSTNKNFEALLARLAILTSQVR